MSRSITLLSLLLLFSALASGAGFMLFRAHQEADGVSLAWEAASVPSVSSYEVYRQNGPNDDFDRLVSLSPTAQNEYRYFDKDVLLTPTSQGPLIYRLTVRTATGTHSYQTTPAPSADNSMARSWDLIKLMFR
ncbi:hypothetical protein CDA63_12895 [Hymenobacter amundsenii]|uniref:Fibronectin type-III domain-containing protein n=1 Tax=Hymenobacter amundsenii TaxID=2006685 RepID=A0A246FJB8_9BACT|nr:hypothetical protein [Hymenobacter amundsenii]OWP62665.1 hypothetical protein CDA63_12895 [Hymenobacter amundsenii]